MPHRPIFLLLALLALGGLAACGEPRDKVEWSSYTRLNGRVTAIDRDARNFELRVLLRTRRVHVAPSVAAFDNLQVGDVLRLYYHRAIIMARTEPGGAPATEIGKFHLGEAQGGLPGPAYVRTAQFTAEFIGMDARTHIATFQLPNGKYRDVLVPSKLWPFASALVLGDLVAVSVEQALTVTPVPVGR